jgi:hypothetical protein
VTAEVAAEVSRQKATTAAVMTQSARITGTLNQLSASAAVTKQIADESIRLRGQQAIDERRLDILEEQSRKPQAEPLSTNSASFPKGNSNW